MNSDNENMLVNPIDIKLRDKSAQGFVDFSKEQSEIHQYKPSLI